VQFTFTLSNFYTRILRKKRQETFDYYYPPRRILLLPTEAIPLAASSTTKVGDDNVDNVEASGASSSASSLEGSAGVRKEHVLVYAPVRHTIESAHRLGATEA
ncbi:10945_t:CDS:1, partial [Acaulospora colombiana]